MERRRISSESPYEPVFGFSRALADAGASVEDVVRTRVYVTRPDVWEEVARAHAEVFGDTRPAATAVVTELLDPRWLVEIKAEALLA